jgi:hypothetical protein
LAGIPFPEIVSVMRQRRSQDALLIRDMIAVRDRYNGDVIVPLPDVEGSPKLDPPIPRLIADAIDHTAMRANSSMPRIVAPALDESSATSRKTADRRRRALYGRWYESQLALKLYRSYRHLVGYGTHAMIVVPDDREHCAQIELRDPLTAYPELRAPDDIRPPKDIGFIFGRSRQWLAQHYPESRDFIVNAAQRNWDTLWDVVEWIDEDEIVVGIMGPRMPAYSPQDSRPYGYSGYELRRWRNKAGMVPVVCSRRVTLDRILGQMSALVGMTDLYSRLMSLAITAEERATFPDMVIMSKGGPPQLISGDWRDGRTGEINLVQDGAVQYLSSTPGPATMQMLEKIESNIRTSGNVDAFYGGDTKPGMRTGRAIDALGAFSVDPRVKEAQEIMERSLVVVNQAVMAVEKGYYGGRKITAYPGLPGEAAVVEYIPNRDYDNDFTAVEYAMPGVDIAQQTVAIAQTVGAKIMSAHTGRRQHPLVSDPEQEERFINVEQLENALLAGVASQLESGQIPPKDGAALLTELRSGRNIEEAWTRVHQAVQKEQAAQMAAQHAAPGAPPAQSAMPGLGGGPATQIGGAPPDLANLANMVGALNAKPNA